MKNLKSEKQPTMVSPTENSIGRKKLSLISIGLGSIAVLSIAIWLSLSANSAPSRESTPSEVYIQKKFQEQWEIEQKEAAQKWDSTLRANEIIKN